MGSRYPHDLPKTQCQKVVRKYWQALDKHQGLEENYVLTETFASDRNRLVVGPTSCYWAIEPEKGK